MIKIMRLQTGLLVEMPKDMFINDMDKLAKELLDTNLFKGMRLNTVEHMGKNVSIILRCSFIDSITTMDYLDILNILGRYSKIIKELENIDGVPGKTIRIYKESIKEQEKSIETKEIPNGIALHFIGYLIEEVIIYVSMLATSSEYKNKQRTVTRTKLGLLVEFV